MTIFLGQIEKQNQYSGVSLEETGILDVSNLMDTDVLLSHTVVIALVQSFGPNSNSLLHWLAEI